MKGYSAHHCFTPQELALHAFLTTAIANLDEDAFKTVRCHELARACQKIAWCNTEVVDGHYGAVEHSWLVTYGLPRNAKGLVNVRALSIIDVYSVGRFPMVQLVDVMSLGLYNQRAMYRDGPPRTDIDENTVNALYIAMKDAEELEKLGTLVRGRYVW